MRGLLWAALLQQTGTSALPETDMHHNNSDKIPDFLENRAFCGGYGANGSAGGSRCVSTIQSGMPRNPKLATG
jgi:hypothetical protein